MGDRGSVPGWDRNFFLCHRVQTGSATHPVSYPMSTGVSLPGVKRPERESDHTHLNLVPES
jgi:hypothetical protein